MYQTVTILGFLGRDPVLTYAPNGVAVANFSLASSRKYLRSDGIEVRETAWFQIEVWGTYGETVARYLYKGSQAMVVGRLVPDPKTGGPKIYTRRDGTPGASFVVRASTVKFLDPKPGQSWGDEDDGQVGSQDESGDLDGQLDPEESIPF